MKAEKMFASLDSATVMFRMLAEYLYRKDSSGLLPFPKPVAKYGLLPLLRLLDRLPYRARAGIARKAGVGEALPAEAIGQVSVEAAAGSVADRYPRRRYPAVAIGSSTGGLTHVWAALGIPWLPQTLLTLVRREINPDDLLSDFAFGQECGPTFLAANPGAALYQMHDPANDRFMAQQMAYFRFKYLSLPEAYRSFLFERLEPGGTIFVPDCQLTWPVRRDGDRQTYQVGGFGDVTLDEYYHGGERVRQLLRRHGSRDERFQTPEPNDTAPESEWGFDQRLMVPLTRLAEEQGFRVVRVRFANPESTSAFAADLYQWWYEQSGLPSRRLFVESFTQMEPYWVLKTRTVPYWNAFNGSNSLRATTEFLANRSFEQVLLTLFSNTVHGIGIPPVRAWEKALNGQRRVETIGVDARAYPIDIRSQFAFYFDFLRKVGERHPLSEPMPLAMLDEFARHHNYPGLDWDLE